MFYVSDFLSLDTTKLSALSPPPVDFISSRLYRISAPDSQGCGYSGGVQVFDIGILFS